MIFKKDKLTVRVFETAEEMGNQAAQDVAGQINLLLNRKEEINMLFAAAPSQITFLKALTNMEHIDWSRINAFHMDEYIGLDREAPQRFGHFLKKHLFGIVPFKNVYYIDGTADSEQECIRYASLLKDFPIDIVCLGIGENGHIAFNDPHVADFNDPALVKVVNLDQMCRRQQVNDGCFARIDDVPTDALTLTVPALMSASYTYCIVPFTSKAQAVYRSLNGEITEACPASVLRTKDNAVLYLDKDSATLLIQESEKNKV